METKIYTTKHMRCGYINLNGECVYLITVGTCRDKILKNTTHIIAHTLVHLLCQMVRKNILEMKCVLCIT